MYKIWVLLLFAQPEKQIAVHVLDRLLSKFVLQAKKKIKQNLQRIYPGDMTGCHRA